MDSLDLRLLRDLGIEPFAGTADSPHPWRPEELAARLKESPRLVKDRMARLERDGVVAGFDIYPNLALLGLKSRTYAFPFANRARRTKILEALSLMDGVLGIVDYITDWTTVDIAFASDEEHRIRLQAVGEALGGLQPETWFELAVPLPSRAITHLDWRILRALRGDARLPVGALADRVGVTAKTVQRRLAQMSADRAFSVFAVLNEASLDELLLCSLVIRVDVRQTASLHAGMADLHGRILADAWVHCSSPMLQDGIHYDLVAAPRTPRALAELLDSTARIPGVLAVRAHLASGAFWSSSWLDSQMDARILGMNDRPH